MFVLSGSRSGKYAKHYCSMTLLPTTRAHIDLVHKAGSEANTISLPCLDFRRQAALEDEFHAACVCPECSPARNDLLRALPAGSTLNTSADVHKLSFLGRQIVSSRLSNFLSVQGKSGEGSGAHLNTSMTEWARRVFP